MCFQLWYAGFGHRLHSGYMIIYCMISMTRMPYSAVVKGVWEIAVLRDSQTRGHSGAGDNDRLSPAEAFVPCLESLPVKCLRTGVTRISTVYCNHTVFACWCPPSYAVAFQINPPSGGRGQPESEMDTPTEYCTQDRAGCSKDIYHT